MPVLKKMFDLHVPVMPVTHPKQINITVILSVKLCKVKNVTNVIHDCNKIK